MSSTARKFFAGRITIPGDSATSLLTLMSQSPLHWCFETTALTTPSLDSTIGDEITIVPDSTVWFGSDANVKNATSGSFYEGYSVAAGATFSLQDFAKYGLLDPTHIYLYSVSGGGADLIFHGR